jgi:hypothetical protein
MKTKGPVPKSQWLKQWKKSDQDKRASRAKTDANLERICMKVNLPGATNDDNPNVGKKREAVKRNDRLTNPVRDLPLVLVLVAEELFKLQLDHKEITKNVPLECFKTISKVNGIWSEDARQMYARGKFAFDSFFKYRSNGIGMVIAQADMLYTTDEAGHQAESISKKKELKNSKAGEDDATHESATGNNDLDDDSSSEEEF